MAEQMRVLQCNTCKTLEALPDYEGPAEYDETLAYALAPHKFPDGTRHIGNLMKVDKKHWDSPSTRKAIIAQIRDKSGHTGLDPAFYDAKNTLAEDAMACWKRHNRTTDCGDYKSEKMRLNPGTDKERADLGLSPMRSNHFLCDHCPMKSVVQERAFSKRGLYK